MIKKTVFSLLIAGVLGGSCTTALAQQEEQSDVLVYIDKYKSAAIAEQQRTGVPAAITLAQGIHESGCGKSELCTNANNHFGIKCKNTWTGATYTYTDDARDECFRKYTDDLQSYADHSDFLKNNKRYAPLFALDQSDYKGWALGLKKCGYATNPQYAVKLINLIERYNLQQYTIASASVLTQDMDGAIASTDKYFGLAVQDTLGRKARRRADDGNVFAHTKPDDVVLAEAAQKETHLAQDAEYYEQTTRNGLRGFYAPKGDLLLNAANKFRIRYAKLLDLNDLADAPLSEDMFIYLTRKNKTGYTATHVVKYGETVSLIAQDQGIRMKELLTYNHLLPGEEPAEGSVLYLQGVAPQKPDLSRQQFNTSKYNALPRTASTTTQYVATGNRSEPKKIPERGTINAPVEKPAEQPVIASAEPEYNIANEPAVEEQMAIEQGTAAEEASVEPVAPVAAQEAPAAEKEMSSLDRLKAKLDKSVYGNQPPQATTPASRKPHNASAQATTPEYNPAASIDTRSAHAALKSKIEQHQKEQEYAPVTVAEGRSEIDRPEAGGASVHIVRKGDTAYSIAKRYGITLDQLIKWNKLPASGAVNLGARLRVK